MVFSVCLGQGIVVEAATSISRVPIYCYTLNGKVNTYSNSALSKYSGYIASGDQCKILQVNANGSVKLQYPTAKGTKTAYAPSSAFFANVNFSNTLTKLGRSMTVYLRSTGSGTIGTVYASDDVIIIGYGNNRTQIIYPIKGGYKMGWVAGKIQSQASAQSTTQASSPERLNSDQIKLLTFNAAYYANRYPDLKAAFGYNEQMLYTHWCNNGIREGRSASPILETEYYLDNNPDLLNAYGRGNYKGAYEHFITHGYKEGRNSSQFYNGTYYRNAYGDLRNLSYYSLAVHYLTYGIKEQRFANTGKKIPDMKQASSGSTTSASQSSKFQWPVSNCYVCGNDWSEYYSERGKDHLGVDVASRSNDANIYATADGTVALVGKNSANGNCVVIRHEIGGRVVYSFYGHLSGYNVKKNDTVRRGQTIGVIGNTGNSSKGLHLHFAFTTQCSLGTYGYGTSFSNNAVSADYQGYRYFSPAYVINNGILP